VIHLPACVPDLHSRLKQKEDNSKHTSNSLEGEGDNSHSRLKQMEDNSKHPSNSLEGEGDNSHSRLKQMEDNSKHTSNSLEGEGDNSHSRKKIGKLLLGPERRQRLREERHEVTVQQGHYVVADICIENSLI
jgi:hypothetical protein